MILLFPRLKHTSIPYSTLAKDTFFLMSPSLVFCRYSRILELKKCYCFHISHIAPDINF